MMPPHLSDGARGRAWAQACAHSGCGGGSDALEGVGHVMAKIDSLVANCDHLNTLGLNGHLLLARARGEQLRVRTDADAVSLLLLLLSSDARAQHRCTQRPRRDAVRHRRHD